MERKSRDTQNNPVYDMYINEISNHRILTFEEEVKLAERIKTGDKEALDELVTCNLRFVVLVAKQYQGYGVNIMDLIAEGNEGLIIAASKFDHTRMFKFVSFAVWYIKQSLTSALSTNSKIVRLPLNRQSNVRKVKKAQANLLQTLEYDAPLDMIADETGLSVDVVSESIGMSSRYVSVDSPIKKEEGSGKASTLLDMLPVKGSTLDRINAEDITNEIKLALKTLSEKERAVLTMFYGIGLDTPLTMDEIIKTTGLTRERARQLKEKGIRRLRHSSRSTSLKNFIN